MTTDVCSVAICDGLARSMGLCPAHYERMRRTGELNPELPIRRRAEMPQQCTHENCAQAVNGGGMCAYHYGLAYRQGFRATREAALCSVEGCARPIRCKALCARHYGLKRRWGTPVPPERPKPAGKKRERRSGYVLIKAPDSPMAMTNGYVPEHRLVMAQVLGRPLEKFENVHHINGVRDDNRPENLELWNTYQPAGQRIPDKVAWATEILRLYEPRLLNASADIPAPELDPRP